MLGKIRRQLWRLIAVMCAIFIPGTMIFIVFNIQAGPLVHALRVLTGVCFVIGLLSYRKTRDGTNA